MEGGDVPGHEAVGGAGCGTHQCQPSGFDALAPRLGLLADDCGLYEDEREEREGDDSDDAQPLSGERPRGGTHHVTLRAVAPLLHGWFGRMVIQRWLRSRP